RDDSYGRRNTGAVAASLDFGSRKCPLRREPGIRSRLSGLDAGPASARRAAVWPNHHSGPGSGLDAHRPPGAGLAGSLGGYSFAGGAGSGAIADRWIARLGGGVRLAVKCLATRLGARPPASACRRLYGLINDRICVVRAVGLSWSVS